MCTGYGYCCCGGNINLMKYEAETGVVKWQRYIRNGAANRVMGVVYSAAEDVLYVTLAQYQSGQYESETVSGETYLLRVSTGGSVLGLVDGVHPTISRWGANMQAYSFPITLPEQMVGKNLNVSDTGDILVVGGSEQLDAAPTQSMFVYWVRDGEVVNSVNTGYQNVTRTTAWAVCGVAGSNDAVWSRCGFYDYFDLAPQNPYTPPVVQRVSSGGAVAWENASEYPPINYAPDGTLGCAGYDVNGVGDGKVMDAATGDFVGPEPYPTLDWGAHPIWFENDWRAAALPSGFGASGYSAAVNPAGTRIACGEYAPNSQPFPPYGPGWEENNSPSNRWITTTVRSGIAFSSLIWHERGPIGYPLANNPDQTGDRWAPTGITWIGNDFVVAGGNYCPRWKRNQLYNSPA